MVTGIATFGVNLRRALFGAIYRRWLKGFEAPDPWVISIRMDTDNWREERKPGWGWQTCIDVLIIPIRGFQ